MSKSDAGLFPAILRYWRTRRGLSQLDLALAADVSTRHVSFLETGRAQPGREMVLRLASTLDVPLRDQNEMLRAAGHAPEFGEPADTELPAPVAHAIDRMIAVHEPFPLTVLDRGYDVVRASNGALRLLERFVAQPEALPARLNVFALLFDPRLSRPFVADWERVARGLVSRLHRESLAHASDARLAALLNSLFEYPDVPHAWRQPDFSASSEPAFTLRLARDGRELAFLTTITTFSAPGNVTLEELRIEAYYPIDDATARACVDLARRESTRTDS